MFAHMLKFISFVHIQVRVMVVKLETWRGQIVFFFVNKKLFELKFFFEVESVIPDSFNSKCSDRCYKYNFGI